MYYNALSALQDRGQGGHGVIPPSRPRHRAGDAQFGLALDDLVHAAVAHELARESVEGRTSVRRDSAWAKPSRHEPLDDSITLTGSGPSEDPVADGLEAPLGLYVGIPVDKIAAVYALSQEIALPQIRQDPDNLPAGHILCK